MIPAKAALTNENQGFTREVIEPLKQQINNYSFSLPTYISILPAGRKESTKYLFDGLEEIYCNSSELKSYLDRIKKRKIK